MLHGRHDRRSNAVAENATTQSYAIMTHSAKQLAAD